MTTENNMGQQIQVLDMLKEPMGLGQIFAESGLFPDVKTQSQAVVKILAGRELGISPMESMNSFFFINNKIAMPSKLMAALIKRSKLYDYSIKKLDNEECILNFYQLGNEGKKDLIGESSFTFKDGAKAGLVNKDNWKNYPRNMLFARALSNGVKWFCPEVVCGYYTVEELEDIPTQAPVKTIELTTTGDVQNAQT